MSKADLVFLPAPGQGHVVSAVEFSKRLIAREPRLSVTVLVISFPNSRGSSINKTKSIEGEGQYSSRIESGIRYIDLPQVEFPPERFKETKPIEYTGSEYLASYRLHVKHAITHLQNSGLHVAGLFVDMFASSMIEVARELDVPSYLFFCSSAAFLGFVGHLPAHSEQSGNTQFDEPGQDTIIPCFQNPVPSTVLPGFAFNKLGYKAFKDHAKRYEETKGIIVNTYAELEPYAIKSLSDTYPTVPVYSVGPVLDLDGQVRKPCPAEEHDRIMGWLDKQVDSSVVFLCFGSSGSFGEDQIREISKGLTQSGQRFLWSVRKQPPAGDPLSRTEYTEMELKSIFPHEFWSLVEKEQGLICGWAPQVEILSHKGTGAFVSHCGWNSILESLWFGKPIVTWPLYSEQQMNAFLLVKELGIAVELSLDYRLYSNNVVSAGEIVRAVTSALDKDNPVRYKAKEMAEISRGALMEGGSSFRCVDQLISTIVGDIEAHDDH